MRNTTIYYIVAKEERLANRSSSNCDNYVISTQTEIEITYEQVN